MPLEPGLALVELSRLNSGLSIIEGALPAPRGQIEVKWNLSEGSLAVSVPSGVMLRLNLASLPSSSGRHPTVNGQTLSPEDARRGSLLLPHGSYHVDF